MKEWYSGVKIYENQNYSESWKTTTISENGKNLNKNNKKI